MTSPPATTTAIVIVVIYGGTAATVFNLNTSRARDYNKHFFYSSVFLLLVDHVSCEGVITTILSRSINESKVRVSTLLATHALSLFSTYQLVKTHEFCA